MFGRCPAEGLNVKRAFRKDTSRVLVHLVEVCTRRRKPRLLFPSRAPADGDLPYRMSNMSRGQGVYEACTAQAAHGQP